MKNRKVIGIPQNSSRIDEIRKIFSEEYYGEKVEIKKDQGTEYYTVYLPKGHEMVPYEFTEALAEFCKIHKCKWWVGTDGFIYKGFWVRLGHFEQPGSS